MSSDDQNPYQTPANDANFVADETAAVSDDRELPGTRVTLLLNEDTLGNLRVTSSATKFASVFCFLSALVPIVQLIALFRMHGMPNGWTTLHTLTCIRLIYVPLWAVTGH